MDDKAFENKVNRDIDKAKEDVATLREDAATLGEDGATRGDQPRHALCCPERERRVNKQQGQLLSERIKMTTF